MSWCSASAPTANGSTAGLAIFRRSEEERVRCLSYCFSSKVHNRNEWRSIDQTSFLVHSEETGKLLLRHVVTGDIEYSKQGMRLDVNQLNCGIDNHLKVIRLLPGSTVKPMSTWPSASKRVLRAQWSGTRYFTPSSILLQWLMLACAEGPDCDA